MVILCIGSDKIAGDALGPLVGSRLVEENVPAYVYGVLGRTVNGTNLEDYKKFIREKHKEDKIVAVDACMGKKEDVGKIRVLENGIRAGGVVKRDNPRIGDIGIGAVVAEHGEDYMARLLSADFSLVESLADKISVFLLNLLKRNHFDI